MMTQDARGDEVIMAQGAQGNRCYIGVDGTATLGAAPPVRRTSLSSQWKPRATSPPPPARGAIEATTALRGFAQFVQAGGNNAFKMRPTYNAV